MVESARESNSGVLVQYSLPATRCDQTLHGKAADGFTEWGLRLLTIAAASAPFSYSGSL